MLQQTQPDLTSHHHPQVKLISRGWASRQAGVLACTPLGLNPRPFFGGPRVSKWVNVFFLLAILFKVMEKRVVLWGF